MVSQSLPYTDLKSDLAGDLSDAPSDLIVDNDLSALDGNDGRPGDAPLLDGLEAQTLKPSGLAVDQFSDYAGVARVAMFRFPRASQFDYAAQMLSAAVNDVHCEKLG